MFVMFVLFVMFNVCVCVRVCHLLQGRFAWRGEPHRYVLFLVRGSLLVEAIEPSHTRRMLVCVFLLFFHRFVP